MSEEQADYPQCENVDKALRDHLAAMYPDRERLDIVYQPRKEPLSVENMIGALNLPEDSLIYRAIDQLLEIELLEAMVSVAPRDLPDSERAHAAGAIDALSRLRMTLAIVREGTNPYERPGRARRKRINVHQVEKGTDDASKR